MTSSNRIEMLVALSAVLISGASFWLAWQQTRAMDAQVKAMSWPWLQVDSGNYDLETEERFMRVTLVNAGVGPARVQWFELTVDGEPVQNFSMLARRSHPEDAAEDGAAMLRALEMSSVTGTVSPALVPAGGERLILALPRTEAQGAAWDALDRVRLSRLSGLACYCSIPEECWITDFEQEPREVEICAIEGRKPWRG